MTYVSKKEKVFDLPDQEEGSSSTSLIKGSDHRLKIFSSNCDKAPGGADESQRYQQLCALVNEKESAALKSTGFKYIPFDVLLTILMAEKDAYIQELIERQEKCTCGERTEVLFRANQFEDCEDDKEALIRKDAEVVALKNRNAGLETELEECRDTLRKALEKLESIEGILNENVYLKEKLDYAEEMIKVLEDNKQVLEIEIQRMMEANGRDRLRRDVGTMSKVFEPLGDGDQTYKNVCSERDILKQELQSLREELVAARARANEMELLRRQSETFLLNLEELSKENECYKEKLEAMKLLEKHVEELRKQALTLTEKYKRESHKSKEQMKQISMSSKEVQVLREERDALHKRLSELSNIESEYYGIKKKLTQFEQIIDENEVLNSKLSQLDKLESDNEGLRLEIDRLKTAEMEVSETKKNMIHLQRAFVEQEEEIKELISQIDVLSKGYIEEKELNHLKNELDEKNDVILQYEKQLRDIPILESRIELLRAELQKSVDEFAGEKKLLKRLQAELNAYRDKCRELEEITMIQSSAEIATRYEEKVRFTEELAVIQEVASETCSLIEMKNDLKTEEKRRRECDSSASLHESELREMLERTNKFKELLQLKDERIRMLESEVMELKESVANCVGCRDLRDRSAALQNDILTLREVNHQLQDQLNAKFEEVLRLEKLEEMLKLQRKSCEFSKRLLEEVEGKLRSEIMHRQMAVLLTRLLKEEALLSRKEICVNYLTEVESLKSEIKFLKTLIGELKKENGILHKMKIFTEFTGKKALENVLSKLRSELLVLQNLSKPELEAECESLQGEVKRLVSEITHLMEEVDNLKVALDAERRSKDYLAKELSVIQRELSQCTRLRSKKTQNASTMTAAYVDQTEEIKNTLNDIKLLKEENDDFAREIAVLQDQCRDFQDEVTVLHNNMDELDRSVRDEREITCRQKEEIDALNRKIRDYEKEVTELKTSGEEFNQKSIALREELTAKEAEIERTKKEVTDLKNEIVKLNSELDSLRSRTADAEGSEPSNASLGKDFSEKQRSEDIIMKVEKELEELRKKLEACKSTEEKLAVLRAKRDNLIVKVNCFESEVEFLKKKLFECDVMKTELEQLKAERNAFNNIQMNFESEEKLLSDIFGLREQLKLQQREIEHARSENTNLKDKLHDLGNLLEVCKRSHRVPPQSSSKVDVAVSCCDLMTAPEEPEPIKVHVNNSTSCDQMTGTITVDELKSELAKAENEHKAMVQKLKAGNAEKIKRLIDQYEKENKNRKRSYNESLNNIKSGYENGIRKLVEKHKTSILRLQNLHEDEVKELNTNYETQMEAMQTLNENVVNDLTSGEVEKSKLTEKHNKEIKDIELKFQGMLKEKENQHAMEKTNLQENLTRKISELKDMHKQDIDNLSRIYEKNLAQLTEKHGRELKKCKKINIKKTKQMRLTYEDLLTEERKKYEEQLKMMLDRLKRGQQGDQIQDDLKLAYINQKRASDSDSPREFNNVLHKIISDGLESIEFDELMMVHCKTCFAAENFFDELHLKAENEGDLVGDGCPHMPLLKEDREELLKKIFVLENEIAIKQLETHEAIINMKTAENCRIEELNNLLRNEREKNSELKLLLTNQSRAQTDLKIESYMLDRQASLHETNFIEKVKELEVERSEKRRLEEELQKEKNNSKHLSLMLESERERFMSQRKKDSDYIEAMRLRLEEALKHEQLMESQLNYEAQCRTKLEFELESLQRSFNLIIDQPSSALPLESKAVKDIKNLDQFESEKEEKLSKYKSRSKGKQQKNV